MARPETGMKEWKRKTVNLNTHRSSWIFQCLIVFPWQKYLWVVAYAHWVAWYVESLTFGGGGVHFVELSLMYMCCVSTVFFGFDHHPTVLKRLCLELGSVSVFWWTGYERKPNLLGPFVEGRWKDHGLIYKSHSANKCQKCGAWVGSILVPVVNYVYATSLCLIQPEYLYGECNVKWNIGTASVCNMDKL
jgi:hypothetical protein